MEANTEETRRAQKLLALLRDQVTLVDAEGKIVYSSEVISYALGYTAEEYIGLTTLDFAHPDDLAHAQAFLAKVTAEPDVTRAFEVRCRHKDGHFVWMELTVTNKLHDPDLAGLVVTSRDISGRKRHEAEIANLNRIYSLLSDTNQAIIRLREPQALFEQICHVAVEKGGFRNAWIGLIAPDTGAFSLAAQAGLNGDELTALEAIFQHIRESGGRAYSPYANRTRLIVNDVVHDPLVKLADAWLQLGARAIGSFPLIVGGEFRGRLVLNSSEAGVFNEAEVKLLDEMALDISFAIEFAEEQMARLELEGVATRYAQRMEILHAIDKGIVAADSTEALTAGVLKHLRALIPCQRASVDMVDWVAHKTIIFAADHASPSAMAKNAQIDIDPRWLDGFGEDRVQLIDDLHAIPNPPLPYQFMIREGMRSCLHVLLMSKNVPFGALSLLADTPGFFTAEDQEIAREIGDQLAVAIQQQRLTDALRQSEIRYRQVVEDQVDFVVRYRPDFTITFVNQTYANLVGKGTDELFGANMLSLLPDEQHERVRAHVASISPMEPITTSETMTIMPGGAARWIQWQDHAVFDLDGKIAEIQAVGRDITERKQAEQAEREQRRIAEALRDSLAAISTSLDVDEVLRRILDYAATVVPSEAGSIILFEGGAERIAYLRGFPPEVVDLFTNYHFVRPTAQRRNVVTERKPYVISDTKTAKDWISFPETAWIRSSAGTPIECRGEVIGLLIADSASPNRFQQSDLENLQAFARYAALALENAYSAARLEQRVAERTAELNEAKERVEAILNSSLDGIVLASPDLRIQDTNPTFDRMFNCVHQTCIGKPILDLIEVDDQTRIGDAIQTTLTKRVGQQIETRILGGDGAAFDAELSISAIDADDHGVDGFVCTVRDITERKHAQQALAEERNLLRTLIDALPDLVWVKDKQHRFVLRNTARGPVLKHIPADGIIGKTDIDLNPGPMAEKFYAEEEEILRTGQPLVNDENRLVERDGSVLWISTTKVPIRSLNGEITGIVGTSQNITERKEREQQLRYHASLQENVSDAVVSTDLDYRIQSWNQAAERIYGWSAEEAIGKTVVEILSPELDSDEQPTGMQEDFERDGRWQGEVVQRRRDGSKLYVLGSVTMLKDEKGAPISVVAVLHDITARKLAEQALSVKLEEEREFQQYLKELHEITIELTPVEQLDELYRRVVELGRSRLGFERLALFLYDATDGSALGTFGTDAQGVLTDERGFRFVPDANGLMMQAFRHAERFAFEEETELTTFHVPTGMGWNAASALWDGNHTQGWLVADNAIQHKPASKAQLDILALYSLTVGAQIVRKKSILARQQSEANLRAVTNSTSVGILLVERDGTIRLANQLARDYGLSLYQTAFEPGKYSLFDLELNDRDGVAHILERVFAGEHMHVELSRQVETRPYVIDLRYDPVITGDGEVIGATVSFIDVTERKLAERAVEKYAAEIQDLYNNAPCGYHSIDANGIVVQMNDTELNWLGYSREEVVGRRAYRDFMPAEAAAMFDATFPTFKVMGELKDLEFDLIRKDGSRISVLVNASAITDSDGQYLMSRTTVFDVTERKRAEAALRESEEKFRSLVEGAPAAIILSDAEGYITLVNAEAEKVFQYRREELVGQKITVLVPEPFREAHQQHERSYAESPRMRPRGAVMDLQGRRKNGEVFHADINLSYVNTRDGLLVMSFVEDITERKRAEEALRESEARYRLLAENVNDVVARVSPRGVFHYVSPSSHTVLGYEPEEMVGKSRADFIHPDDAAAIGQIEETALQTGIVPSISYRFRHKGGHYVWLEITRRPILSQATPEGIEYIALARDITERKRAEDALRESEARYRLLAENITDLIARVDTTGRFEYVSPSSRTMLGYEPDELVGRLGFELAHPDDLTYVVDSLMSAGDPNRTVLPPTFRYRHKDGHYLWMETSGQLIWSETTGEVIGFIVVARDVTERHAAEEALRHSEELLRKVLENLPVGVWLVAPDGTITFGNAAAQQIWAGAKYVGMDSFGEYKGWWLSTGKQIEPDEWAAARAVTKGETSLNEELEIEAFDGTRKYLLNSAIPIRDDQQNIVGAIIVNHDVTVMKLAEHTLREAFEQEKELSELKSRFVSMASHEFRTPLATILSSSEMLLNYRKRMDEAKIDRKLTTIAGQVKHLTSIVEDVLDLTRMQTGRTEFKPILSDLDALCREVLDEFRSRPEVMHTLIYHCNSDPVPMLIDKKLMRQIIINLITNAIKYSSPDTSVNVSLEFGKRDAVLRVNDEGIGIPEPDLRHLFEPFHRAGNVGTISGTGLGLSITKQAVEMHDGTIKAESQVDIGSTFTVTLPLNTNVDEQPSKVSDEMG